MQSDHIKPFYISAFTDGTQLLAHDEYGVYVRLLEYMWQSSAKLPNDDAKIAHYLRITRKKWQNYKQVLQNFFVFSDKTFTNIKLKEEYQKSALKSKQNSANAFKRWGKSIGNEPAVVTQKEVSQSFGSWKSIDAIASNLHMPPACYARASNLELDIDKIDDRWHGGRLVDKSAGLNELMNALSVDLGLLFGECKILFPEDKMLLAKWLDEGISSNIIYGAVEKVSRRITKKNLPHPKSFAYFSKEVERRIQ